MNERIRELVEQASTHAEKTVHYYMGQFDGLTWEAKILKARDLKLAELIVGECRVALNTMLRDMISRGHAYDLIKQHFGVEE